MPYRHQQLPLDAVRQLNADLADAAAFLNTKADMARTSAAHAPCTQRS
jgi:hypothetical protein